MGMFDDRYDDSFSSGGSSYLDWGKAGVQKEDWFKTPKHGKVEIDIVPFLIGSEQHPRVAKGKADVGDPDYALDIWVHKSVGPGNIDVVCLKRNYNQPCAACDAANERLKEHGNKDEEYISLKAKRRMLYNIIDVRGDEDAILVWDVSHFLFEKELIEKAKYEGEKIGKLWLDFADPEKGFTIRCRTASEKFGEFDTTKFKDFEFIERDSGIITPKMIKSAVSFDEFLTIFENEQIEDILGGSVATVDEHEEEPVRRKSAKTKRVSDDEEEEETPKRRSRVKDEEEDEAPVRKTSKRAKRDDPEESDTMCPYKHKFGVDHDEYDDCDECQVWTECKAASK